MKFSQVLNSFLDSSSWTPLLDTRLQLLAGSQLQKQPCSKFCNWFLEDQHLQNTQCKYTSPYLLGVLLLPTLIWQQPSSEHVQGYLLENKCPTCDIDKVVSGLRKVSDFISGWNSGSQFVGRLRTRHFPQILISPLVDVAAKKPWTPNPIWLHIIHPHL